MSKTIEEILLPKPEARPRIYAYSIADQAHAGLLKVGQTTRDVQSQPRRGVIFVETPRTNAKLRRSDIIRLCRPYGAWANAAGISTKMALLRSSLMRTPQHRDHE